MKQEGVRSFFGLGVFAAGFVLVLAVHPERFSGWALWALSPPLLCFAYLLVFRGPPQRTRAYVMGSLTCAYSAAYGLAAGFGDESYTDVAKVVYLFLPATGLLAFIMCIPVVEFVGALSRPSTFDAFPLGPGLIVADLLLGGWTLFAVTGWLSPSVIVDQAAGHDPEPLARLRCEGAGTHLLTPTVVRYPDGMHLRVDNHTGGEVWVEYEIDGGARGGGGEVVPPGISEYVIRRATGSIDVVCSRDGNASDFATITLVNSAQLDGRGSG